MQSPHHHNELNEIAMHCGQYVGYGYEHNQRKSSSFEIFTQSHRIGGMATNESPWQSQDF